MNTKEIEPIFNQSCVISIASSSEYVPYLCVYLTSLKEHTTKTNKYDIVILEKNISNEDKEIIKNLIEERNISIRFYNPSSYFAKYNLYISDEKFSEECYYRIIAPVIFKKYKKVIFTDLDLIVLDDILELNNFDLQGNIIASTIEPIWIEFYDKNYDVKGYKIKQYTSEVLQLTDPYRYFNTGVCVIDTEKYNKNNSFEKIIKNINKTKYLYQEQDAINVFFKDNIIELPDIWNYELDTKWINNQRFQKYFHDYKEKEYKAKILHFLGGYKPWLNPLSDKAYIWWEYARKTPYYEKILQKIFDNTRLVDDYQRIQYISNHLLYFYIKKLEYKIKAHFPFKKEKYKEKYKQKYITLKQLLKEAKKMIIKIE